MRKLFLTFLPVVFFSCSAPETDALIVGKWKCVKWLRNDIEKISNYNNIYFRFYPDKTYTSRFKAVSDSGIYRIEDSILHVSSIKKMEIAVKILRLTADSLNLLMNNAGNEERMFMVKEK